MSFLARRFHPVEALCESIKCALQRPTLHLPCPLPPPQIMVFAMERSGSECEMALTLLIYISRNEEGRQGFG